MKVGISSSRIIPGDRGKIGPGWLVRSLETLRRKLRTDEAAFTGSAGNVRALPGNAKKEPERRAAIDRSRCQSSEVTHGQFRPVSESQLPRGQMVVTAHQHGMNDSGGLQLR